MSLALSAMAFPVEMARPVLSQRVSPEKYTATLPLRTQPRVSPSLRRRSYSSVSLTTMGPQSARRAMSAL